MKPLRLGVIAGAASLGVLVVLVVVAIALKSGGGSPDTGMVSQHVTAADGGVVTMPGGPTVTFPPGALDRDTTVTIRQSQSAPAPDRNSLGPAYEIEAGDAVLVEPAMLRMPFDRSRVQGELNSDTVALAYFDGLTQHWISVASALESSGGSVVYATDHFSNWQVQNISSSSSTDFALPYAKSTVSVKYVGGPHQWAKKPYCPADIGFTSGVDFGANGQEFEVLTIASGRVIAKNFGTEDTSGPGFWVTIEHDGGIQSSYWHLKKDRGDLPSLEIGQEVPQGFPVGLASNSGDSTMSKHAHVELSRGIPESSTSPYGTPVSWSGRGMDGWTFWLHEDFAKSGTVYSYQGSATRGGSRDMEISISGEAGCGLSSTKVRAKVGPDYKGTQASGSSDDCILNGSATRDTAFACDDGRGLHLHSSNCERHVVGGGCVDGSSPPVPSKTPPPVSPTDPMGQVPAAPSQALIRAIDKNTVEVSWKAASNNHTGFRVYGTGGTFLMEGTGSSLTSLRINGLSPGEHVCANVRAFNSAGESGNTYAGCATTPNDPGAQPPAAPSQASIKAIDKNTVEVSWKSASTNHTGFRVYGTGGTFLMEASASFASLRINGFSPGSEVCVNVRAFNSAGESGNTYAGCATTDQDPAARVPAAPSEVGLAESWYVWCPNGNCPHWALGWNDNSNNETGFRVFANGALVRSTGSDTTSVGLDDVVTGREGTVCFTVSAYNAAGESAPAGGSGNACRSFTVSYSLTLEVNGYPAGTQFQIGSTIGLCYQLAPSNVPYTVRVLKSTNGNAYETVGQWNDSGGGDCFDATVGAPAGTRTYLAQAIINGAVVAEATTVIGVVGAQSYSFSGTLAGAGMHAGPGDGAPVQWTSAGSTLALCYHLAPEGVPYTVRLSLTRGTYYANAWQAIGTFGDDGAGGGGCVDATNVIKNAFPPGICYATLKVEAIIQGTVVGEITIGINRHFGC